MDTITIKVCGKTGSEKSTIMTLIERTLQEHGIYNVRVYHIDPPFDNDETFKSKIESIQNNRIDIEEVQINIEL